MYAVMNVCETHEGITVRHVGTFDSEDDARIFVRALWSTARLAMRGPFEYESCDLDDESFAVLKVEGMPDKWAWLIYDLDECETFDF